MVLAEPVIRMSGLPDPASFQAIVMSPTGTVFISAFAISTDGTAGTVVPLMSGRAGVPVQPAHARRTTSMSTAGTIMAKELGIMRSPMKPGSPGCYKRCMPARVREEGLVGRLFFSFDENMRSGGASIVATHPDPLLMQFLQEFLIGTHEKE